MIRPPEGPPEPPLPELSSLAREQPPPPALEPRVVAELRAQSLLRAQRRPWRQIAAAVLLLGTGIAAGRFTAPASLSPAPTQPRFLLLLSQAPTDSPGNGRVAEYRAWAIGLREAGRQISGERLAGEAVAVDQDSAPQAVNDDTQGYFIVSAASLDEAVALARSSPHVRAGGRVIVRPIASP